VPKLPNVILSAVAFCNFAWLFWQSLNVTVACVACPWYYTEDFPIEAFLLLTASFVLFIHNCWSYLISFSVSGIILIQWVAFLGNFFYRTNQTISEYLSRIRMDENNPLTIWESQMVIATAVFSFAAYFLVEEIFVKKRRKYI
jgi:hypothetical protein